MHSSASHLMYASAGGGVPVYLERGPKRTFAGALEWPGWCRIGRDPTEALAALSAYRPRYAQVLHAAGIAFDPPDAFVVHEQLTGNADTDFGAPVIIPAYDHAPMDDAERKCLEALLHACWRAFDRGVQQAEGEALRKGPRGGGRDQAAIVQHVFDADGSYLTRLAWKGPKGTGAALPAVIAQRRAAMLQALGAAARGETPERGPRGGVIWPARYGVRRVAWHVLDHLWEIEDRLL